MQFSINLTATSLSQDIFKTETTQLEFQRSCMRGNYDVSLLFPLFVNTTLCHLNSVCGKHLYFLSIVLENKFTHIYIFIFSHHFVHNTKKIFNHKRLIRNEN